MSFREYQPGTFGERHASIYDQIVSRADEHQAATFLATLAGDRPALELGIGTGRAALPLANLGVRVDGIDASPEMVACLRKKPGGDQIRVHIGNFADVEVEGRYGLIYVLFNTLFNLVTQDEQVRCFQNVADHLLDDGVFVVEAFIPDLQSFSHDQSVRAEGMDLDRVVLEVRTLDAANQRIEENHVHLTPDGVKFFPIITRYTWPSELDLMARLAGLRLRERSGCWTRTPFESESRSHVSVYERVPSK